MAHDPAIYERGDEGSLVQDNSWRDFLELTTWFGVFTSTLAALEEGRKTYADVVDEMRGLATTPTVRGISADTLLRIAMGVDADGHFIGWSPTGKNLDRRRKK